MPNVTIAQESPRQDEVIRLIKELDAYLDGLYRKLGFKERGPFGPYGPDPLSVFMEKVP